MIVTILIIVCILALLIDYFIYKNSIKLSCSKFAKRLYLTQIVVINLTTILTMSLYSTLIINTDFMSYITWIILVFLTSFIAKLFFATTLLIRKLLKLDHKSRASRSLLILGYIAALIVVILAGYGTLFGATTLRVEHIEIQNSKLPKEFDGFQIALFSDVHLGNFGKDNTLIETLVDSINLISPDIVVESGDFVNIHSEEITDRHVELFSKIKAQVYSVLGNHDLAYYISDTLRVSPSKSIEKLKLRQQEIGWKLMENRGEWLYKNGDSIYLAGVTYPDNIRHNGYNYAAGGSNMPQAMQGAKEDGYSILIAHSPTQYDSISKVLPDLILSGHTHAMQFKLSLGDWKWSPASLNFKRYSGLYSDHKNRDLYINDGFGYVLFPLRFGASPELTILTLRSKSK